MQEILYIGLIRERSDGWVGLKVGLRKNLLVVSELGRGRVFDEVVKERLMIFLAHNKKHLTLLLLDDFVMIFFELHSWN